MPEDFEYRFKRAMSLVGFWPGEPCYLLETESGETVFFVGSYLDDFLSAEQSFPNMRVTVRRDRETCRFFGMECSGDPLELVATFQVRAADPERDHYYYDGAVIKSPTFDEILAREGRL